MAQKVLIDSKVAAMFKVLSEYKHHEVWCKGAMQLSSARILHLNSSAGFG
jgi:hypothetical protein